MEVVISIDVELWSWGKNFEIDIAKALKILTRLADNEKIPIVFFISLSDKGYGDKKYFSKIKDLLKNLQPKNIEFGIHTHCKNLPLNFKINSDMLKDYSQEEITKILNWYKKNLEEITCKKIWIHRAGNYSIPPLNILEKSFKKTGLKIDSSDISKEYSKKFFMNSLLEIPPATNKKYSAQLRVWSPEQMSFNEMIKFYENAKYKTDFLVINFHSFSVYGNLGLKKKIWYLAPKFMRKFLRPFINILKQSSRDRNAINVSKNFENLVKLIRFLKKENCKFVNFKDINI